MKLDENRVKVIKQLFSFEELKDGQIATLFGVSREQINHIRNGHRWSEVTGIAPKTKSNDYRNFTTKEDELKERLKESLMEFLVKL